MRSGKDTVADYLASAYRYKKAAFGDALRRVVYDLYPEAMTSREEYRRRMQEVGQHMRAYDPDVWVRAGVADIDHKAVLGMSVVVTDMRQPNEYAAMKERGALIVRVDCPPAVRALRAGGEASRMSHETESHFATFDVDYVLTNDRTYSHLYQQIDTLMREGVT